MCPTSSWCWVDTVASLQLAKRTRPSTEFLYRPKWRFAWLSAGGRVQLPGEVTRICWSGWLPRQKKLTSVRNWWRRNIGLFSCRFELMPVFGVHWFKRHPICHPHHLETDGWEILDCSLAVSRWWSLLFLKSEQSNQNRLGNLFAWLSVSPPRGAER